MMKSFLDNIAASVAGAAGWREPQPDSSGGYSFSLRDSLDFKLVSPDGGNTAVFLSPVRRLQDEDSAETLLHSFAGLAVSAARDHRSTLALDGDAVLLQLILRNGRDDADGAPAAAEDFLNDLSFWRSRSAGLQSRS